MREYPEADVERIIGEEVMRSEGTTQWTGPKARTRIEVLLMSRLCAAWSAPAVRIAVEAIAAAESEVLYYCGTNPRLFVFQDDAAYNGLIDKMMSWDGAVALALAAHVFWPAPDESDYKVDLRAGLEAVREQWARARQQLQDGHRAGKRVSVHSNVFIQIHGVLMLGYAVFLTKAERDELNAQVGIALKRIHEYQPLFFAGPGPTAQA